jgi:hypothetical protein
MPCTDDGPNFGTGTLNLADPETAKRRREMYYGGPQWEPCLTATSYGHVVYTAGEHTAYCALNFYPEAATHRAPKQGCSCGHWCYYTPDKIDIGNTGEWTSLAAVQVWGDIVPGTKGVRAEKMQIVGVLPPDELMPGAASPIVNAWREVVAKLGVKQYRSLAELLKAHPPQDVSGLIPKEPEGLVAFELGYRYGIPSGGIPPQYWSQGYSHTWGPTPVVGYSHRTQLFSQKCTLCSYDFTATSQATLDHIVMSHYTTVHLMPASATADAA